MGRAAWLATAALATGFGAGAMFGVWAGHKPWASAMAPPIVIDRALALSDDVQIAIGRIWLAGDDLRVEAVIENRGDDAWWMGGAATPLLHDDRGRFYPSRRMRDASRAVPPGGRIATHFVFDGPLAPAVEKVHLTLGDFALLADIPVSADPASHDVLMALRDFEGARPSTHAPAADPVAASHVVEALRDLAAAIGGEIEETKTALADTRRELASLQDLGLPPGRDPALVANGTTDLASVAPVAGPPEATREAPDDAPIGVVQDPPLPPAAADDPRMEDASDVGALAAELEAIKKALAAEAAQREAERRLFEERMQRLIEQLDFERDAPPGRDVADAPDWDGPASDPSALDPPADLAQADPSAAANGAARPSALDAAARSR